jgi:transcriptional regulator GlxA family with amidase domain
MVPISFGFLSIPYQLLDVSGSLDILSSTSIPYLKSLESFGIPPSLAERGIDITFHHIGLNLDPVEHTGKHRSVPTCTVKDCPPLDYLLIGGPSPEFIQNMPKEFVEFIRSRTAEVKTVFTTCSGGMVLAASGVLDGMNATTNHGAVPMAAQTFPSVKWTKERQWVIDGEDGKFWTAGGACAGMDMMAHWVMQHYGADVAMAGFGALDYSPRGQDKNLVDLKALMQNGK